MIKPTKEAVVFTAGTDRATRTVIDGVAYTILPLPRDAPTWLDGTVVKQPISDTARQASLVWRAVVVVAVLYVAFFLAYQCRVL